MNALLANITASTNASTPPEVINVPAPTVTRRSTISASVRSPILNEPVELSRN